MKDSNKYLIIGGSTKCGTTSVFNYFEFHPEICPCKMKESRYFLESDYHLVASQRNNQQYQNFSELFQNCKPATTRLEATPDYLYSKSAADKIKTALENCKFVFILRNPVDRLDSWFRFASLNGLLTPGTSIEDYILQQQQTNTSRPQHLRSLEQGRYATYLGYYLSVFGKENIHVCFYEDLQSDPGSFCKNICQFAGIDFHYFDNYNFRIFNKSVPVKSVGAHRLFRKLKRTIRPFSRSLPESLRKRFKLAGYNIEKAYSSANKPSPRLATELTPEMKIFLEQYYAADNKLLVEITGKVIPWT